MDRQILDEMNKIRNQIDDISKFISNSGKDDCFKIFNSYYDSDILKLPRELNNKLIELLKSYKDKLEKQFEEM